MAENASDVVPEKVQPKTPKRKKAGAGPAANRTNALTLVKVIVSAVSEMKDRRGTSMYKIKRYLGTHGVDVDSSNGRINKKVRGMVDNGDLVQVRGKGASGSFKLGPKQMAKKPEAKKPVAKKPVAKKPAAKKAAGKKPVAKKPAAKKAAGKKPTAKKPAAKKPAAKKKTTAAKKNAKKSAAKKPAAKNTAAKNTPKKKAPKKETKKRAAPKKRIADGGKAPSKKTGTKK
ncbi:histone H1-like [Centropristis striata]|uniref:histone H1-like n=1 Tax=Centropristis striata TaxID=184440 RepID=UPI0027E00206|nr:histone H1-like [Centropristis striata]